MNTMNKYRILPDSSTWMIECLIRYLTLRALTMSGGGRLAFMKRMTKNQPDETAKYIRREVELRLQKTREEARQENAELGGRST